MPPRSSFALPIHDRSKQTKTAGAAVSLGKRKRGNSKQSNDVSDGTTVRDGEDAVMPPQEKQDPLSITAIPDKNPQQQSSFDNSLRQSHRHVKEKADVLAEISKIGASGELDDETPTLAEDRDISNHGLRRQHVTVLTAILHRCLLNGDYKRAGRAWGMILRTQTTGAIVDLRKDGMWGIGAEILLRKGSSDDVSISKTAPNDEESHSHLDNMSFSELHFSQTGFERAKDYYARLILQHPWSRTRPNTVSSLDFYRAMFGLWIHQIQDTLVLSMNVESRSAIQTSERTSASEAKASLSESWLKSCSSTDIRKTLEQSESIAETVDALLISPPYSDDARLLLFRGMLHLWTRDLAAALASKSKLESEMQHKKSLEQQNARKIFNKAAAKGAIIAKKYR